jgi:hypothetical protein
MAKLNASVPSLIKLPLDFVPNRAFVFSSSKAEEIKHLRAVA